MMLQPRIVALGFVIIVLLPSIVHSRVQLFDSKALLPKELPSIEAYEVRRENVRDFPAPPSSSQGMKMVNISRNSDLMFGEVTQSDSALLLQCQAPYPVQWVFRGDSDPEFNTNTTTTNGNDGNNMYRAYLYLGARRNLNERETGKYICTSVRNKRQYSFVYVFVTKSALFTNKGLETIHFSPNEDSVRIPCSLSEPRAIATLQKSQDGVLKCPMNDSVRFDPKQGFVLNPKRLAQPEGTYLCIADYNNNFQIIKYELVQEDKTESSSGEHESNEASEFDPPPSPPNQAQAPSQPTPSSTPPPQPSSTSPPPPSSDDSKCSNKPCGENASCRLNNNGTAVCKCMDGYTGNPYVECKSKQETSTTTTIISPPADGNSDFPCSSYDDCPYDRACYQNTCQDPCLVNSICGPHTHCHAENHTPICECDEGYDGDPYSSQEGQQCEQSHCSPNPCGPNSNCNYVNGIIACSCKPGFATHNDGVCRPHLKKEDIEGKQPTSSTYPPRKPIAKPHVNSTQDKPKASVGKECHYDIDCPDDKMCVQDKCEDPCVNACGSGAKCHTRNHFPRCVCPEGTTGDPFYKCTPLFSEILGSTSETPLTTNAPSTTTSVNTGSNEGNGANQVNCGGKYSPCGPNTICQATRNHFVCSCPNNYLGDPYSKRGCFAERGHQKCEKDSDCFHFMSCLRNRGCVNPCNVRNVCKPGRSCVPHLHKPACLKTNLDGETLRDGLVSADENEELGISEVPETLKNSSCFVKSGDKVVSPCGRNSICYDPNANMTEMMISESMPMCGCMAGYIGDPYVACEPLQPCKNSSSCSGRETCYEGFCKEKVDEPGRNEFSELAFINPCSPSPCANPEEQCVITRKNYTAICLTPGQALPGKNDLVTQRAPLSHRIQSRSGLCQNGGDCEEVEVHQSQSEDDEAEDLGGNTTTEWAADFTLIPPTTALSASYISSASASASIEDAETISSPRYFITNFNYSNENERTLSVIDA